MQEKIVNYYEFTDETSSKFWEITLDQNCVSTRYGKIGSNGQSTEKTFGSVAESEKEYQKLIKEKLKKGYQLVETDNTDPVNTHIKHNDSNSNNRSAEITELNAEKTEPITQENFEGYEVWEGDLILWNVPLAKLPEKLHVKGNFICKNSDTLYFSRELVVDGDWDMSGTNHIYFKMEHLERVFVKGKTIFTNSFITLPLAISLQIANTLTQLKVMDELAPFSLEQIAKFKHINELVLYHVQYDSETIRNICHYQNLEYLSIHAGKEDPLPWCVEIFLLPKLKTVQIHSRKINESYAKLLHTVVSEQYPFDIRRAAFYLLANDTAGLNTLTDTQLISAYKCDQLEILAALGHELARRNFSPFDKTPLTSNSVILLLGKFNGVQQLKANLDKQGIKTVTRYNSSITHVAIGVGSKVDLTGLESLPLIPERYLQDWLQKIDTPFLLQESSLENGLNNKLKELLSADVDSQLLALDMIKTGGVTDEIFTYLVFLRYHSTNKIAEKSMLLIKQYGSIELIAATTKSRNLLSLQFEKHLKELSKVNELDIPLLVFLRFRRFPIEDHAKLVLKRCNNQQCKEVIDFLLKDSPSRLVVRLMELSNLPDVIADFPQITALDASGNCFTALPSVITKLPLEELDIVGDGIQQLPPEFYSLPLKDLKITVKNEHVIGTDFSNLPLQNLEIKFLTLTEFPAAILKNRLLENLIVVSHGSEKYKSAQAVVNQLTQHAPLLNIRSFALYSADKLDPEIKETLRKLLPNCERFVIQ